MYEGFIENIDVFFFKLDSKGRWVYLNRLCTDIFGWPKEEMAGKKFIDYVSGGAGLKFSSLIKNILNTKNPQCRLEAEIRTKTGIKKIFGFSLYPDKDTGGKAAGILGIGRDITRRKRAEQREKELLSLEKKRSAQLKKAYNDLRKTQNLLFQAEKMAAVGQLVSGIAHEVKNPLCLIVQGVNLLENEIAMDNTSQRETLSLIKEAAYRIDIVARGLLNFAKPAPLELTRCEINKVIKAAVELMKRNLFVKNIEITQNLSAGLPLALIDANQMEQVFINIILNSSQSMPEGGEIVIKTYTGNYGVLQSGTEKQSLNSRAAGNTVIICEVIDTGIGIPKNFLSKVFEPFFSTKPSGEGTGLGLAITKSILKKHKGTINIESEEGKGTKVTIALPLPKENG
ncbi:MAG: ATP-binding protein [Candidatus Omnitrophota bacterium]